MTSVSQLDLELPSKNKSEDTIEKPPRAPKLRVVDLSHAYGERLVLKNLSFELNQGELLGVLGPNGAGKTTLFQILCGLLQPQGGHFILDGRETTPMNPLTRESLGVVFQQPSLDLKLSALENLLLAARLHRVPGKDAKQRATELMHFMELGDRLYERVESFSGGMRRRLEIIRALIHGPKFLILDEPTSGLDEMAFQKIWKRLLDLQKKSKLTMILTSHRADEAEKCDRLLILHEGQFIANDSPQNLMQKIGGDVLTLEFSKHLEPREIAEIQNQLLVKLGLEGKFLYGKLQLEKSSGHEWIPKIVESFPAQTFLSINIHRPTLADVFMHLTGRVLEQGNPS